MTDIEKCPCEECILLAICRHKIYWALFRDCDIINTYIPKYHVESERNPYRVEELEKILNPVSWSYAYCIDLNQHFKMIVEKDTMRPRV